MHIIVCNSENNSCLKKSKTSGLAYNSEKNGRKGYALLKIVMIYKKIHRSQRSLVCGFVFSLACYLCCCHLVILFFLYFGLLGLHLVLLPKEDDPSKAVLAACNEKELIRLAAQKSQSVPSAGPASGVYIAFCLLRFIL